MVMQNRHDGANSPGWWDDLPPGLKKRFANAPGPDSRPEPRPDPDDESLPLRRAADGGESVHRPGVIGDLSRLAILFVLVALANLLFLLVALAFLFGSGPLAP